VTDPQAASIRTASMASFILSSWRAAPVAVPRD